MLFLFAPLLKKFNNFTDIISIPIILGGTLTIIHLYGVSAIDGKYSEWGQPRSGLYIYSFAIVAFILQSFYFYYKPQILSFIENTLGIELSK